MVPFIKIIAIISGPPLYHGKMQNKNFIKELPPNVAKEPEKVDDQIDIPIAPKDSNDSKEGEHQYII